MPAGREALFYQTLPDGRAHCTLCPHGCRIHDGYRGACGVRINHRGVLFTLVHDRIVSQQAEPIEKKPLFHFLPGSSAFSVAAVGCCLHCSFCQNWEISQWPAERLPRQVRWSCTDRPTDVCPQLEELAARIPGERTTPREIVEAARLSGCASIAYTFTEPTVFFELAYETAVVARASGLRNVFVTSGFISEAPLRRIAAVLDAVNVDLKFFRADSYARVSRARLQPVLDAIRLYRELGVWVEVTTLVIPGLNDSDQELRGIAGFIRSVGPEIPWHVTRFHPAYRMRQRVPTPVATLLRARQIGLEAGLRHVYTGNLPGGIGENSHCPACGALVIERSAVFVRSNRLRGGRCPDCGAPFDGVGLSGPRPAHWSGGRRIARS